MLLIAVEVFYSMKWLKRLLLLAPVLGLWACPRYTELPETSYTPVLMERSVLETAIRWMPPRDLGVPAKIYWLPPYLLISEQYKGVHIFNNSDPANPEAIGFVRVDGCVDMAIVNGLLAVDNAVDLVLIDLTSQPGTAIVKNRQREVFPEITPPDNGRMPFPFQKANRPPNTVIVAWEKGGDQ